MARNTRRSGHARFTLEEVIERADHNERTLEGLARTSPDAAVHTAINDWLLTVHRASLPVGA